MKSLSVFCSSWMAGLVGLASLCVVDFSSFCHPSEETAHLTSALKSASQTRIDPEGPSESKMAEGAWSELTWRTLEDVEFKDVYVEELDAYYWKPSFGQDVKDLEGQDVYVSGYIIPVDLDEDFYVLSRYPFANCFFCGGAGPESVVDLRFDGKSPRVYQTDERLTFAGKFRLNSDDVYQMNYILDGAVEYTP
ncbi:MAG: hypothetical protein ACKVJH_03335 [Flavobacteriales bacterium]|jgi:hypothetical protein